MNYYHLVTNKKMKKGQVISFNQDDNNTLYKFFFEKSFINSENRDINEIVSENSNSDGLSLNINYTNILNHYLDNSSRSIRETITEMVRLKEFPHRPSRLNCLYVTNNYDDLMEWKKIFESYNRKILQIVKLKTDGKSFSGDGENLPVLSTTSFDEKIKQARRYWNRQSDKGLPEVLIDGNIEVVDILEDFNI